MAGAGRVTEDAHGLVVAEESIEQLRDHADVPISFTVERVLVPELVAGGLGGVTLHEMAPERRYVKDYDVLAGESPTSWAAQFDVSAWGLLTAFDGGRRLGGAVVAWRTPDVSLLEGRDDLAVLWDLRVCPELRGAGVGSALFRAVESWARARGCVWLKAETQNVNVPACRFYARMGCVLGGINLYAYPELPGEVQLLWYRQI